MGLVRTLVAECDGESCSARATLDADSGQPFHQLSEIGWSTGVHGHEMVTYCNACTRARAVVVWSGPHCNGCGAKLSTDNDPSHFLPVSEHSKDHPQCRSYYGATGETPMQAYCGVLRKYV